MQRIYAIIDDVLYLAKIRSNTMRCFEHVRAKINLPSLGQVPDALDRCCGSLRYGEIWLGSKGGGGLLLDEHRSQGKSSEFP